MNRLSQIEIQETHGSVKVRPTIKVCMHVLGTARNDVRVMRSATALAEAGFTVSIVDIEEKRNQPPEEEIHGVRMHHIFMSKSFMAVRFRRWTLLRTVQVQLGSMLRLILTPADIYHAHDVSGLPACYIAARLRSKPLIFDAHELPLAELSNELFLRLRRLLTWLLAGLIAHCAGVITVSLPIAQEIRNHYPVPKVTVVRNMPLYQSIPTTDRLRHYLGLSKEIRIALYQGNLMAGRGLDRLTRAAAFLERDIVIVMMGQGELETELKVLIADEEVADRVKVIPPAPYTELLEWTASADLGLMVYSPDYSQNIRFCLPNKLFEYLMAGLPILTSQLDAVVDVIRPFDVGQIVTSLEPIDVAKAINSVLADQAALIRMSRNALNASQQDLCWEKEKQQLIRLYNEILDCR